MGRNQREGRQAAVTMSFFCIRCCQAHLLRVLFLSSSLSPLVIPSCLLGSVQTRTLAARWLLLPGELEAKKFELEEGSPKLCRDMQFDTGQALLPHAWRRMFAALLPLKH